MTEVESDDPDNQNKGSDNQSSERKKHTHSQIQEVVS